jgi:hypothetical protein
MRREIQAELSQIRARARGLALCAARREMEDVKEQQALADASLAKAWSGLHGGASECMRS